MFVLVKMLFYIATCSFELDHAFAHMYMSQTSSKKHGYCILRNYEIVLENCWAFNFVSNYATVCNVHQSHQNIHNNI